MFSMKYILIIPVMTLVLSACNVMEIATLPAEKITVGSGPEDMVLDYSQEFPRLLISCTDRRETHDPFGEILAYTPSSGIVDTMVRTGTPDTLYFQPHGIFLDAKSDPPILYSISHEHDKGFHPVYVWEVHRDTLLFREVISSELLHSPNALAMDDNGSLYVVNDAGKRGSILEKIIKLNRANIIRLGRDEHGKWQGEVAAEKLGYPAGINTVGNTLYAGDAINHLLHVYKIEGDELVPKSPVKGLRGNDNIRVIGNKLYLTGHVKPFRFIGHTSSPEKLSPVQVCEYDPVTDKIISLYYTDGSAISAGSTALVLDGYLYISQVFDPFILRVDLRNNH